MRACACCRLPDGIAIQALSAGRRTASLSLIKPGQRTELDNPAQPRGGGVPFTAQEFPVSHDAPVALDGDPTQPNQDAEQFAVLSRQAIQQRVSSGQLLRQSLETPLGELVRGAPVAVDPSTPLRQALAEMQQRRIGSVLVVDAAGSLVGILTRHDILGRVTLPALSLDTPIREVMSAPVQQLGPAHSAYEAALMMTDHGIRHVPVVDGRQLLGIVSERDLFALQRLSISHLGMALREASDAPALRRAAADIRRFAAQLLAQGIGARQLTELISRLNDRLTARAVELLAGQLGLDLGQACWLAFGSEGREEQTLATDQDNGIVFLSEAPEADRPKWLALGAAVNQLLADCGYPLCRGGVMAGQPACCLSQDEWRRRFSRWIDQGSPQDVLNATIYFDLRPVAGKLELARPLRQEITARAAAMPRFLRQMAESALAHRPPLNWLGKFSDEVIDLKLQGTALFVEAARLLALAVGVEHTSTRQRLLAAAGPLRVPTSEAGAWVAAFEHLQLLRLGLHGDSSQGASANHCAIASLNDLERSLLTETLKVARRLQQRIELDYLR